jgi:hypothetical protein
LVALNSGYGFAFAASAVLAAIAATICALLLPAYGLESVSDRR